MTSTKPKKQKKNSKPSDGQVSFTVNPGTKMRLTIEAGEVQAGKVPVRIRVNQVEHEKRGPKNGSFIGPGGFWDGLAVWSRRIRLHDLGTWLFISALIIYLATRLIGLTRYPIYFFTDEAIQTQAMVDLAANGYRNTEGILFPTYFRNGEYANLSLSVYLQWLPWLLFGKSAFITRATSVVVTLIAAISIGILLRDAFKIRSWWTGTLLLSITPSWFLHSRTAFETAEFTAFYAGALCAYLLYRYRLPGYLYISLVLGALAFYTYSPGQLIVPATALALLVSDWRYHLEHRHTAYKGLGLVLILALPYLRYRIEYPGAAFAHLHTLGSYLLKDMTVFEKIVRYLSEYFTGLSALYWYIPNNRDLPRHLMDHYGNILVVTLPFAVLGLAHAARRIRESAHRTILIVFFVSPIAAALVQTGITRALVFVLPAAILTAIGLDQVLQWIENPSRLLSQSREGKKRAPENGRMGLSIFLPGVLIALFIIRQSYDRMALLALVTVLALQVSGRVSRFARWFTRTSGFPILKNWSVPPILLALVVFIGLSGINVNLLSRALTEGPTWDTDYGMGGMQYGAFQIFEVIKQYRQDHPEARIVLTPNWANGTDVVARFFLNDPLPIEMGSIQGYITEKFPLDDNTLFIMTPAEYALATQSSKLKNVRLERIIPYPDGSAGFHFVRLRYVDEIDGIFAAEKALRQVLQESVVSIDGREVKVRYSYLEADMIHLVFDGDPLTLAKTFEANPFVIEMTFPSMRTLNGFSIVIGSARARLTLKCYSTPDAQPVVYTFEGQGSLQKPELSFDLPQPQPLRMLRVEMLDPFSPAPAKIHIWELKLR